ncbi:uncharacterized protein K460DRAFT_374814 [Cucurbitaria berberidis CBS 394.84]|uniref:Uncharacterized protein n=1 Tax=Cucurbitaria berberidis CBS 394.84 TaxID=1168544 RepID=A0A9P4GMM5_9PLEO|nr:uncharacterized protein K460DRAFT_374814 [Cucurbitaria berberidis CBS 394.84]KAF1847841.1 hypothetical protein K460DRAFT_374814 [Cucurbitaria berberidis CBS 394.84]
MLLFYEHEPDSANATSSTVTSDPAFHEFESSSTTSIPPKAPDESLTLHNTSSWTYCGPLLVPNSTSLPPSFHSWSAQTTSDPSILLDRLLPLLSFLHTFLSEANAQNYWLTIRATTPTNEYNTPRWHTDDDFFSTTTTTTTNNNNEPEVEDTDIPSNPHSSTKNRCWKLATILLGPPTLFIEDNAPALDTLRHTKAHHRETMSEHACTSIRCLGCATYAASLRHSLSTSLAASKTASPGPNEVAFFRIGDEEGAVHSEPKCDVDRIFVNVVPGTESELRRLMARWGMGFPRAWCFGVPVGFIRSDERFGLGWT